MRSRGTRKKSPSHMVTGVSNPASLKVQPRPPFPISGALYRGEEGRVSAGRFPHVLDGLQPFEYAGVQRVTREVLERAVDHRQCRLVWRVVVSVVRERSPRLGVEDVVYELVGVVGMLGALGYGHVVRPARRRRLGDDVVEVLVRSEREEGVPREDVPEQEVAVYDRGPVL